jgi:hypothetical protein
VFLSRVSSVQSFFLAKRYAQHIILNVGVQLFFSSVGRSFRSAALSSGIAELFSVKI